MLLIILFTMICVASGENTLYYNHKYTFNNVTFNYLTIMIPLNNTIYNIIIDSTNSIFLLNEFKQKEYDNVLCTLLDKNIVVAHYQLSIRNDPCIDKCDTKICNICIDSGKCFGQYFSCFTSNILIFTICVSVLGSSFLLTFCVCGIICCVITRNQQKVSPKNNNEKIQDTHIVLEPIKTNINMTKTIIESPFEPDFHRNFECFS